MDSRFTLLRWSMGLVEIFSAHFYSLKWIIIFTLKFSAINSVNFEISSRTKTKKMEKKCYNPNEKSMMFF